jgi:hypothetical protein
MQQGPSFARIPEARPRILAIDIVAVVQKRFDIADPEPFVTVFDEVLESHGISHDQGG